MTLVLALQIETCRLDDERLRGRAQYKVVRAREPASFWREKAIIILLRLLTRISQ